MNYLDRIVDCVMLAIDAFVGALFTFIFVLELANVVLRHGFATGIPQTTEGAAYMMAVITYLGMASAFLRGEHINLEIGRKMLPSGAHTVVAGLAWLLTLGTMLYIAYFGVINVLRFRQLPFAPASMPWLHYWIPMSAVPIGAILAAVALVVHLHRTVDTAGSVDQPPPPIE